MVVSKNFKIGRPSNVVSIDAPLVFGISGFARCGKDSLGLYLMKKLRRMGLPVVQGSFSDAGKRMLDPMMKKSIGISAFTNNDREKKIIRPLFVCFMTDVCRKIDEDFWIKKIEKKVENNMANNIITVITDVRYVNEAKWIKNNGGFLIHITRLGQKPACINERYNGPLLKRAADYKIKWKTFTDAKETCHYHLSELFMKENWSTYGKFR